MVSKLYIKKIIVIKNYVLVSGILVYLFIVKMQQHLFTMGIHDLSFLAVLFLLWFVGQLSTEGNGLAVLHIWWLASKRPKLLGCSIVVPCIAGPQITCSFTHWSVMY